MLLHDIVIDSYCTSGVQFDTRQHIGERQIKSPLWRNNPLFALAMFRQPLNLPLSTLPMVHVNVILSIQLQKTVGIIRNSIPGHGTP